MDIHWADWINNTTGNYFIKQSIFNGNDKLYFKCDYKYVFLYWGISLSIIRWNQLNYSDRNITWIFSIWRLAVNFSLEKRDFVWKAMVGQGQKFCSLVIDKIVKGTLWALGSKPTSSYLLMLKNYVLIFIFILFPVPMLLGQYANSKTNCIHLHIVHIVDSIEEELKLNWVFYSFIYPVWF